MCHKPSRSRSNHTCTCARFLRNVFEDACVVGHQGSGRKNKPAKGGAVKISRSPEIQRNYSWKHPRDFYVGKFPARQELTGGAYVYAYALGGTIGGAWQSQVSEVDAPNHIQVYWKCLLGRYALQQEPQKLAFELL